MTTLLGLQPGVRLLDVGAGAGWPGLYLAKQSGCDAVLVDLPLTGVRIAAERTAKDGMSDRCRFAVADGAQMPFRDGGFDVVSHSDILCCLKDKRGVLEDCRRVTRDGGRMVFTVIGIAPGLSRADHGRGVAAAPEFGETETYYQTLLRQTGWTVAEVVDVTEGYADTNRRFMRADGEFQDQMEALIGAAEFAERQAGWRSELGAVEGRSSAARTLRGDADHRIKKHVARNADMIRRWAGVPHAASGQPEIETRPNRAPIGRASTPGPPDVVASGAKFHVEERPPVPPTVPDAAVTGPEAESAPPPKPDGVTRMMAQYLEIKRAHPDVLLFYRMGDFYELFFDDAVAAAAALDITLTKRGKHDGADIPMCGVPVHAAEGYLARLTRKGFKVAIGEQVEAPAEARKRGAKSLVKRAVVRVVTAGTLTEDTLLDPRRHNYLAAIGRAGKALALAWLDVSTGEFGVQPVAAEGLAAELARLQPGELLAPDTLLAQPAFYDAFAEWKSALTPLPAARFDSASGERRLKALFKVAALDAFGAYGRAELGACGALIDYVELTQKGQMPRLAPPRLAPAGAAMSIDAATRRNLELTATLSGERTGSLLSDIDRTVSGAGARLLAARLAAPLTDAAEINRRLDAVAYFVADARLRDELRGLLARCPDIERALSRLTVGRGGPRDLGAVRDALAQAALVHGALAGGGLAAPPEAVAGLDAGLGHHDTLVDRLARALKPETPLIARDGGFIAQGYAPELDELVTLRDESRRLLTELEARYRADTAIASLKVRHNNVLGYFVEVTPTNAHKVTEGFIHRQTLAGAVRYTTVTLGALEDKIRSAAERALALELELFENLVGEVVARADEIAACARALAGIDLAAALASLAVERDYTRPVVDDSLAFDIAGGRHPVVEALAAGSESGSASFVANDCDLGPERRLWLVTGPNMAGKSTFLRQNALIAILAQTGAFVPAARAHIGVVDRLFSRVGAADDLARGRSTFMVEMVETAAILNQSGDRALVILDEIGRGTATFDGLSIAWATVEHLHDVNRCRALFATHYHELTALAARHDALACHSMRVKEWQGAVIFLYEVAPGAADRSYGIHVSRLAGLPPAVVARAEHILETLEQGEQSGALARLADDLPLFSAVLAHSVSPAARTALEDALAAIAPDELSPKDALEAIYRLKSLAEEGK